MVAMVDILNSTCRAKARGDGCLTPYVGLQQEVVSAVNV